MADNVAISAGAGTSVGTDDVGGVHFQKIKIDVGGDGVSIPWGGASPYTFLSTAAVLSAAIKASPGHVYAIEFFNLNAAARYVRLYNMTTAPATTDGANIIWRGMIPGGGSVGAGFVVPFPGGLNFSVGIGIRVTAAVADNDGTALAANEIMGNVQYK